MHMNHLVIDIGNSRIKSAFFEKKQLISERAFESLAEAADYWMTQRFTGCIVSSVRYNEEELKLMLPFQFVFLTINTSLPLKNGYGTPATLGLDRLAAAVGAWELAGQKSVVAIDLGTCITYELVDDSGTYLGGAISPGLVMRAKAMAHFTVRLPEISIKDKPKALWGNSTVSCINIGVWEGVRFEMEGFISSYRQKFPKLSIYICGGDSHSFESLVKDHIFVVPNLVLHGLNCILNHNVE
jgi:type III pantothenate kinase